MFVLQFFFCWNLILQTTWLAYGSWLHRKRRSRSTDSIIGPLTGFYVYDGIGRTNTHKKRGASSSINGTCFTFCDHKAERLPGRIHRECQLSAGKKLLNYRTLFIWIKILCLIYKRSRQTPRCSLIPTGIKIYPYNLFIIDRLHE